MAVGGVEGTIDMPETLSRAIGYYKRMEYIEQVADDLEKHKGKPRKHIRHDVDLFENWKEHGEKLKKASEHLAPNQRPQPQDTFASQKTLTNEFCEYIEHLILTDMEAFYFYLCMGREPSRSWGKRHYIVDEQKVQSSVPYFREQMDGLYGLINLIEVLFSE